MEPARIHCFLAIAADKKAEIEQRLQPIENRRNRGRALILPQQCLERRELSVEDVGRILEEYGEEPHEIFRLVEALKFADATEVNPVAKADIEDLRQRPMRLGRECAPAPIVILVVRVLRKVVTVLFCVDYAAAPASPHSLERGKSQGSQATVEQPLIDITVVGYQVPEASSKLRQIASGVKSSKQTDAVQNLEAFGLAQFVQRNECLALPAAKK